MVSKKSLQEAAEKNIIKEEQIEALYQVLQASSSEAPPDGREEPLKFIRSFGDVFITLGIVLLVMAVNGSNISGYYFLVPVAGLVILAEWLVRVRKLALPGIAILLAILFFVNRAIVFQNDSASMLSLGVLGVSSLLFYLRYKMPFSLLALAASLVAMASMQAGFNLIKHPEIFSVFGLVVFAVAMWFDSRDTKRVSHMSDGAFWLHLLAAPLIVHGLMLTMLTSDQVWFVSLGKEWLIIAFFVVFFLLALLVDRRAMIISTQLYMIYALTKLLQENVNDTQNVVIYIFLALGIFVIYFGTYWYRTRRFVFGFLSKSFISHYVPDFKIQDVKK